MRVCYKTGSQPGHEEVDMVIKHNTLILHCVWRMLRIAATAAAMAYCTSSKFLSASPSSLRRYSHSSSSCSTTVSHISCCTATTLYTTAVLNNDQSIEKCTTQSSSTSIQLNGSQGVSKLGRRELLLGAVAASSVVNVGSSAEAYTQVEVGAFLQPAEGNPDFVQFIASQKDTPALRAGNVQPYKFILPPTWKQVRIANILSGNYCQPKCAEPWIEVKFENAKQGTVQVVASPMVRLSNKPNATIEEIGNPEKIISALGPFVTGNSYDPDEVRETSIDHRGDLTYYSYQLETPFAFTGSHNLATATAKGNVVLLFVVSANDQQWASSQQLLKTVLKSFTA